MKIILIGLTALLAVFPLLAVAGSDIMAKRDIVVGSSENIAGDLTATGNSVEVAGTVAGDIMAAAGNIDIPGNVAGDVLVTGGNVNVSGKASQNVRAAGGTINISGTVAKNVTVAGGSVRINKDAVVSGSAYVAGGSVTIAGTVSGSLRAASGMVVISGKILGDVIAAGGTIAVRDGAEIAGNLTYYSDRQAEISSGAKISGQVVRRDFAEYKQFSGLGNLRGPSKIMMLIWKILSTLVVAAVGWRLFGRRVQTALDSVETRFWNKIGWGAVLLVVTPVAAVLTLITVVGIPLGLMALSLYAVTVYLACVLGTLLIGRYTVNLLKISDVAGKFPWYSFLFGVAVTTVIGSLPIVGGILGMVVLLWGLGSLAEIGKKSKETPVLL